MTRHLHWVGLAACVVVGCGESAGTNSVTTSIAPTNGDGGPVAFDGAIPRTIDAGSIDDGGAPSSCGTYGGPLGSLFPATSGVALEFDYQGLTRAYKVYVPSSYQNDVPTKVLYVFHGLSGTAEGVAIQGTHLDVSAEQNGFVLVMPSGYDSSWNAGNCCGTAKQDDIDDVGFVREVQRRLTSDLGLCVDSSRVYATGYSNGAFLTYRLACEASDMFAAVASVAGTMAISKDECAAGLTRPVPLLEIHGDLDWIAPYDGQNGKGALPSVEAFASLDGCAADPVPTSVPTASLDTSCRTYPGCSGGAEVTLCEAATGGHCWYGSPTCGTGKPLGALVALNALGINATTAVWSFVSQFACDTCGR